MEATVMTTCLPYSPLTITEVRHEVDVLAAVIADEVVVGVKPAGSLVEQYAQVRASWLIRAGGEATARRLLAATAPATKTGASA
jgi:hypothetical protein